LGSNPDSDDEEPPPAYHGLFGDEGDVHAYGPIDGHFTVEYHRHAPQVPQFIKKNHVHVDTNIILIIVIFTGRSS
jgi:hypothetical protein